MSEDGRDKHRRRTVLSAGALVAGASFLRDLTLGRKGKSTAETETTTTTTTDETTTTTATETVGTTTTTSEETTTTTTRKRGPPDVTGTFIQGSTSTSGAPHPLRVDDTTTVDLIGKLSEVPGNVPLPEAYLLTWEFRTVDGGERLLRDSIELELDDEESATVSTRFRVEETDLEHGEQYVLRKCVETEALGEVCVENPIFVPERRGELTVTEIHADPEGDDAGNLENEFVRFENTGSAPLELGGWQVRNADDPPDTYTFPPRTSLDVGAELRLLSGEEDDGEGDFYWGSDSEIWHNDGDTITVTDDDGNVVLELTYA